MDYASISARKRQMPSPSGVFYSRRDDEQFYRWSYVGEAGRWPGSRVRLDSVPKLLVTTERVPAPLRAELLDHREGS